MRVTGAWPNQEKTVALWEQSPSSDVKDAAGTWTHVRENPTEPGGIKSAHYIGMTAGSAHNRWKHHREGHVKKVTQTNYTTMTLKHIGV